MKYKKISNFYVACKDWSAGRNAKGELLKEKACWACKFNLFGYCWFEAYNSNNKLVIFALEGNEKAKRTIHEKLKGLT